MSPRDTGDHPGRESVNVRERLVGDREAEQLGIENDRRTALASMGLGAVLIGFSVLVLVQAMRLPDTSQPVGPGSAPTLIGILLLVVGVLVVVNGRRNMGTWEYSEHTTKSEWLRLAALLGVLVAFAVLLPIIGYVVSSTLLFGAAAILLGSPHRLRPFAYGWTIAAAVFLIFDTAIGLTLPSGPWGF